MLWSATAPSNIALIKYMGKAGCGQNIPLNPSLSYTLPHLFSTVEISLNTDSAEDIWEPFDNKLKLTPKAQTRFLNHLKRIKNQFNCEAYFKVCSGNNFPQGAGLASSASSFAALTKAATLACSEYTNSPLPDVKTQANLSRQGSGSSCRSFFEPWVMWEANEVSTLNFPYPDLIHQVILIEKAEKAVSSSEAHLRVSKLPNFNERIERAESNLKALTAALNGHDWKTAYQITYQEFEDMHALFEQADPPFSYITDKSREALSMLQALWTKHQDGPLITMDAGPNVHLLYRPNQTEQASSWKQNIMELGFDVM